MKALRIGTRDSQLAVWQATLVQDLLKKAGVSSELVSMKSEGDIDTVTPLYALGVTGVFTKTLDAALLNNRIDIAVHSMKDVPTQLAEGIQQAAVLARANEKDIFVPHPDLPGWEATAAAGSKISSDAGLIFPLRRYPDQPGEAARPVVATGSIRRIAQWLHRFPDHTMENLRGNVNTRLRKLKESTWHGAIFAAAGLERIGLRPDNAVDLEWMLPAPAQGAIMVVCREGDKEALAACQPLNDEATALCTKIEKDFLRVLMGGCSTPISALAEMKNNCISFKGNICAPDGSDLVSVNLTKEITNSAGMGGEAAQQLLSDLRARQIIQSVRHERS